MNFAKNLGLQIESFSERTLFFCIKISLFFTLIGQSCVYGQQISINDPISVNEGNTGVATITFIVSVDAADFTPPFEVITADYEVFGGLENGTTGTVTFPVFSTDDQTIDVTTTGDFIVEADEIVTIELSNPSTNAIILDNTGISSFLNDDTAGVSVNTTTGNTTEAGGVASFLFTLTSEPVADVTIPLSNPEPGEGTVQASVLLTSTNC